MIKPIIYGVITALGIWLLCSGFYEETKKCEARGGELISFRNTYKCIKKDIILE